MAKEDQGFEIPEGVDPELVPYLLAAQESAEDEDEGGQADPDAPDATVSADSTEEDEGEDEELAILRDIVRDTLLAGADPELIDAVLAGELGEEEDADDLREAELDEAEAKALRAAAARTVYESLLKRAPEHDFDPSLDRVRDVLSILGDPQDAYPSVHVGGTNGKSSTTRMIASLFSTFGLRTGSFTSPHLLSVNERVAVNGVPLTDAEFVAAWEDVAPYIAMVDAASAEKGEPQISYFEALTIMAMAWFADAPADVAVFEVGMGGRWDSTNVLDPGVAVITPIAMDHERWLGSSLSEVAFEKAGIIKDRSIVVVCHQDEEVMEVIERKALETDSVLWVEGTHWEVLSRTPGVGGQIIDVRTPTGVYEELFVPLHGEHQAHNAAAALVATEAMMGGKPLPTEVVEEGFLAVRSPGRLEVVRRSPTIVVDAAHNPAGVAALKDALEESFRFNVTIGLFSAMGDKAIEQMLVEIESSLDELVIVEMGSERGADIETLKEIAEDVFGEDRVHVTHDVTSGIDEATRLADAPTDPTLTRGIVAFGSIQFIGEVTGLLRL